jgi:hypothetical protein
MNWMNWATHYPIPHDFFFVFTDEHDLLAIIYEFHPSICSANTLCTVFDHPNEHIILLCKRKVISLFHYVCICLLTDSQVGAWITFSCQSPSQNESMTRTSSRTFLPATTAHLASYWSSRRGCAPAWMENANLLLWLVCKCCSFRFAQMDFPAVEQ